MAELTLEMLRAELAPIKLAVRGLPVMGRAIEALHHDTRQLRAAVNDIAALQMTAGEAGALHHDLDQNTTRLDDIEARLLAIEDRLKD
jgi:hypothetical protein